MPTPSQSSANQRRSSPLVQLDPSSPTSRLLQDSRQRWDDQNHFSCCGLSVQTAGLRALYPALQLEDLCNAHPQECGSNGKAGAHSPLPMQHCSRKSVWKKVGGREGKAMAEFQKAIAPLGEDFRRLHTDKNLCVPAWTRRCPTTPLSRCTVPW